MEEKKVSNFKFILIFIIFLIAGIILYSRFISTKGLKIKEYPIYNSKISSNFEGLKIVHFSDLLYGRTVNKNDVRKIVTKINELKPDIVVFTGDLIDKDTIYKNNLGDFLTNELSKIEARLNKFAIFGDFDYKIKDYEIIMKNAGFTFLNDSYDFIYDKGNTPLLIIGLPSSLKQKQNYESAFAYLNENPDNNLYQIVLTHEADAYDNFKSYNPDLVLAGHSLNGQIKIPYVGPILTKKGSKKYYNNYYKEKNTDIFVSSGIGTTDYSFRLFNKPSINLYRLYSQK